MGRDLAASRMLAWRLLRRDLSVQYRQTVLGYAWAVLPAVMLTLVWVVLNSTRFVSIETGDLPYAVYALTGSIFWFLFVDALNAPLKQLALNRSMLNRVSFPPEALVLAGIGQVVFGFFVKLFVLGALLALFSVSVGWSAALVLFPAGALLALGTVLGVLISPIGLLYRDVEHGLTALVTPLMFVTPVIYPPPGGTIGRLMELNPLTPLFEAVRGLLYEGSLDTLSGEVALVFVGTVAVGAVAWIAYRVAMPVLVERMEA